MVVLDHAACTMHDSDCLPGLKAAVTLKSGDAVIKAGRAFMNRTTPLSFEGMMHCALCSLRTSHLAVWMTCVVCRLLLSLCAASSRAPGRSAASTQTAGTRSLARLARWISAKLAVLTRSSCELPVYQLPSCTASAPCMQPAALLCLTCVVQVGKPQHSAGRPYYG
jgi:hypothetical protein